jgi:regulator of protease activity HflC (stomatin/prohibitin superfamily)
MEPGIYIVLAIIVLLIIIVISNIKIVPQAYVFVVERLGAFHAAWGTGLHVKVPFIDRVAKRVSIKEQVVDFKPQSVITKDNVTMQIDTVVFFQITNAMEKQMKADRERREKVIQAEAEKKSQVLVAEGEKESKILRAQADKESQILAAEAEKQSMILRADAVKEQKILEAEGEAQAIDMVQKAIAESIVKLNAANPNEQVIQLKSLEAFAKAADGKATKIIIPSEIQGIAGLATGLKEVMTDVKKPQ